MSNSQEFITPSELAKLTGQKPQAIYNLARQGYIKTEQGEVTKTQTMISKDVAEAYVAKREEKLRKAQEESANTNS